MTKRFFSSMTSRIFLILVGGTIISGTLVTVLAQHERKNLADQIHIRHAIERIQQVILTLEAIPTTSRKAFAEITEKSGIRIGFLNSAPISGHTESTDFSAALTHNFGSNRAIESYESWGDDCPTRRSVNKQATESRHCQTVITTLKDGTPVKIDIALRDNTTPLLRGDFLFYILTFLLVISVLSLIVAYIATKPLRELAIAAKDFGNNIEHPALSEKKGPKEVREAAVAFNTMQASIRSHIQERTYMLAAIAHDLQTPLTRLRLRLEKVSDVDLKNSLIGDLMATQAMVKDGLEYARLINAEEPFELVDLDSLIAAICNDAIDAGCTVTFDGKIGRPIAASPHALRRCIANLLENAIKYGSSAHVHTKRAYGKAIITITDDGPGIPIGQLEAVFQPFKRIDNSRSRSTGGTGLGLTIARIITEKHHGIITLSNTDSSTSGLIATLELPLENYP